MLNRKNFIQLTSMSVGSFMVPGLLTAKTHHPVNKSIADLALNNARSKGASYVDVRISSIQGSAGIRVLVNGSWGFASTASLTNESIVQCAEDAVANAATQSPKSKRHQYDLKIAHDVWSCAFFRK